MKTGLVYDKRFLQHDPGTGHPECKERLSSVMNYLGRRAWFDNIFQIPPLTADERWLMQIHTRQYLERARLACLTNQAYLDTLDVGISRETYDVALLASGATLVLADRVLSGEINNGFALIRPPGHHAETDLAMGFCLLNNVAILARYLQIQHRIDKIAILDWDVHHGNGTQHIFESDPSVLYISAHQYPFYPGTGAYTETGIGRGQGYTLNCPMPAGSTDGDYTRIFHEKILPKIENFKPEFIIISSGFDAHQDDPLGGMRLSTEFFGWMTERIAELANKHCAGRIISVLEGGYNLDRLPLCIEQHLLRLAEIQQQ
jgi:acetoin utilization deacetylase AcuC-like enzyme